MNRKKVLVGMSGGVDSALTAYLLKKAGYEVYGAVLRLWETHEETDRPWTERTCCHVPMVEYLCSKILDIPYEIHESAHTFQQKVIVPFKEGYLAAQTPNPCTSCNAEVKIRTLLRMAREKNIDAIATGHYASWAFSDEFRVDGLKISKDLPKDQSYFLSRTEGISPHNLLLPLGTWTKAEVRVFAESVGFPVSGMLENQEACFISEKRIGDYLAPLRQGEEEKGEWTALTRTGASLGSLSSGIGLTRGQRRGHGIAGGERLYVLSVDPANRQVLLGKKEELLKQDFVITDPIGVITNPLPPDASLFVRFRSTMPMVSCRPIEGESSRFLLDQPHDGIVPGQVAAFYDRHGILIGSGLLAE